jgi:hypothetical protein
VRWWAVRTYSFALRVIAITSAFFAVLAFLLSLFVLNEIQTAFAANNILFAEGLIGVAALNLCGLGVALLAALGIYALGQLLMLLISLEYNLRGLRADLRNRGQREIELPGPPAAAPFGRR